MALTPSSNDLQLSKHRFRRRLFYAARQLTDRHIGAEQALLCIKDLESLERQLKRVSGNLVPIDECDELQKSLADVIQHSREICGQPSVTSDHQTVMAKSTHGVARHVIPKDQLEEMVRLQMTLPHIARVLKVSVSTIQRRLIEYGINYRKRNYSSISNDHLDEHVREAIGINRAIGSQAIHVRIERGPHKVKVPRQRVRDSVQRVDPVGVALRALRPKLQRRVYSTPSPNSVWHIDGNHKLIRWGIVIHAGVDGFSRLCTFCGAAPDNLATTVASLMLRAVACYGLPQRVCSDQGGENNLVILFMQVLRGCENRPSIRVPSNRNERIERHWNDVWRGVTNIYHTTFHFLESEGYLDVSSPLDMALLHYIYLPRLSIDLETFHDEWNNHKIRTAHHKTPEQIFTLGMIENANTQLQAVRDFFDTNGIPQHSSRNIDSSIIYGRTYVQVTDRGSALTEEEVHILDHNIPAPSPSDKMWIDLYIQAKILVLSARIPNC